MKLKLIVAVLLMNSAVSLTAFSQESNTTLPSWQVDSLINRTMDSKEWENMSEYYRNAFIELGNKWRETQTLLDSSNNRIARLDSAWRVYARSVEDERDAQKRRTAIAENDYQKEHEKRTRVFGVGPELGYNPFTKSIYGGVGVHLSIFRFGLFRNKGGNNTPVPDDSQQVINKLYKR
jgi:hypothetical protein